MNPLAIGALLLALVGGSSVLGAVLRARSGRVQSGRGVVDLRELPGDAEVTLLQFSSTVCAPCVATRRSLESIARQHPGVRHLDVDVASRPDLASRLHVLQTPTTLIVDASGTVCARIGGAPRPDAVRAELTRILGTPIGAAS